MDLILTDASRADVAAVSDYDLDLAFGGDENDFELVLREGPRLTAGCLVYVDGTEYGGIVDEVATDSATGVITYKGPTWHGLLAAKVLSPLPGQDHLAISGDAIEALGTLVGLMGLGDVFAAEGSATPLKGTYRFARFTDGYSGIAAMLKASGLKLAMRYADGRVRLSAAPIALWGDDVDSDRATFSVSRRYRPVNHLVCLGKGELRDRAVVHVYADERGTVSQTQTLMGIDERAETYEQSSAEAAELLEKGLERLGELQGQGEIDVTASEGGEYAVGDLITGRDNLSGEMVTAEVVKKILRVESGAASVEHECGMGAGSDPGAA